MAGVLIEIINNFFEKATTCKRKINRFKERAAKAYCTYEHAHKKAGR
jgi:hypothetical protein